MPRRKNGRQSAGPEKSSLDLLTENELKSAGYSLVVGADEAGRGPLAGPVVAVAVCLPAGVFEDGRLKGVYVSPSCKPVACRGFSRDLLDALTFMDCLFSPLVSLPQE